MGAAVWLEAERFVAAEIRRTRPGWKAFHSSSPGLWDVVTIATDRSVGFARVKAHRGRRGDPFGLLSPSEVRFGNWCRSEGVRWELFDVVWRELPPSVAVGGPRTRAAAGLEGLVRNYRIDRVVPADGLPPIETEG